MPLNPRIYSLTSLISTIVSGLQSVYRLSLDEAGFFAQKIAVYATSSDERRLGQWDHITWADYIRAGRFSDEYNKFFADGTIRNLAATKSKDASTHSIGLVGEATLWSVLGLGNEPGGSVDRVLDGATNERWIDPWTAYLEGMGVRFAVGWEVDGLTLQNGRIASATAAGRRIETDWFIVAMPSERAARLITPALAAADPKLAGIARLRQNWMNGLMFYLRKEVPLTPGHVNYVDSAWAVTSISQAQFWDRDLATYGDGTVKDCLSTIISDWFTPGTFNGRRAKDCTPAEIAEETWRQIKAHTPDLTDDLLHSWFLDPAIANGANDEPLFIQHPARGTTGPSRARPSRTCSWPATGSAPRSTSPPWKAPTRGAARRSTPCWTRPVERAALLGAPALPLAAVRAGQGRGPAALPARPAQQVGHPGHPLALTGTDTQLIDDETAANL